MLILIFTAKISFADEYSANNYKILDPVIAPSGFSNSSGFQLWSSISEIAVGTSSSASFQIGSGFLNFPFASTPVVSATAGNGQVSLSWTASTGFLGWTANSYSIGRSTTSGGPYSYTSAGSLLNSTVTGLTNGTTYYFVITVSDIFGNTISTSTEVSSTPSSPSTPPPSGGGGGGGGGAPSADTGQSSTGVVFSGRAYPLSKVNILKDGSIVLSTIAGPDSNFTARLTNINPGGYNFGVYGEDKSGSRSSTFTFSLYITQSIMTEIGGIFISPTISVDKKEVKKGDNIAIFGQSAPKAEIVASVNSEKEHFVKSDADKDGIYLINFDTSVLEMGEHHTKSKSSLNNQISDFSNTVAFLVGTKNIPIEKSNVVVKGDVNNDKRVNLIDFSIVAFWYKKPNAPANVDINGDKKVDIVDFSIMAFNWTG